MITLPKNDCDRRFSILSEAVDNTNEAFVTIDQDSTVIFYNKAAENMFGYGREEVLGKNLALILGPGCREGHAQAVQRLVATGEAHLLGHETEFLAMRRNGDLFPASISFSVTQVEGKSFFTGLMRDMTETKKLQQKIIAAERLAALGQTVAEISHEIKNPLLMIGGFARQLLKKIPGAPEQEKLRIIASEVGRLENLLAELKDLYTPRQMAREKVNVCGLLQEVHALAQADLDEKKIRINLKAAGEEIFVEGDRQKLKQVLLNVVKNGIEALEKGGELSMAVNCASEQVEILITDAGPGIPQEILEKIFVPFFTTKKKGTGLGLSVSKKIIEDHQGSAFSLKSEEGKGTEIKIVMPRSAA